MVDYEKIAEELAAEMVVLRDNYNRTHESVSHLIVEKEKLKRELGGATAAHVVIVDSNDKLTARVRKLEHEHEHASNLIEQLYYCYMKGFPKPTPEPEPNEEDRSIIRRELRKVANTFEVAWVRKAILTKAEEYRGK